MNQINVLGIDLNNYSLRESLVLTEKYLQEGPLRTILYVDAKMLVIAGQDARYKECLSKCDLTIINDEGILQALPKINVAKIEDVKESKYTRILLKKLAYGHKRITLLADSEENLEALSERLLNYRDDLNIVAKVSTDTLKDSTEAMLNQINDIVPDVIISQMEETRQAGLMEESRRMMNCKLWIGLPEKTVLLKEEDTVRGKLFRKLFHSFFKKEVRRYETQKKEE